MPSRFTHRSDALEIMDDLECQGEVVNQTLRELEFINRWLGGNAVTLDAIRQLARGHAAFTLADLGCGGGEMLKLIAEWGRRNKLSLKLTGIDANPNIVAIAKDNCKSYPEISIEGLDVFSEEFHQRNFDIVTGTLFFHHFQQDSLISFFSRLKHQVRIGIIINDIHRHRLAYYSIRMLTRLFSKSTMVKFDAPLSVLRAFSRRELTDVLTKSGFQTIRVTWKWAFRWQAVVCMGLKG